jgi:hypothetical protein
VEASPRTIDKSNEISKIIKEAQAKNPNKSLSINYIHNKEINHGVYESSSRTAYHGRQLTSERILKIINNLDSLKGTLEGLHTYACLLNSAREQVKNKADQVYLIYSFLCPDLGEFDLKISRQKSRLNADLLQIMGAENAHIYQLKFKRHGPTEIDLTKQLDFKKAEPEVKRPRKNKVVEEDLKKSTPNKNTKQKTKVERKKQPAKHTPTQKTKVNSPGTNNKKAAKPRTDSKKATKLETKNKSERPKEKPIRVNKTKTDDGYKEAICEVTENNGHEPYFSFNAKYKKENTNYKYKLTYKEDVQGTSDQDEILLNEEIEYKEITNGFTFDSNKKTITIKLKEIIKNTITPDNKYQYSIKISIPNEN